MNRFRKLSQTIWYCQHHIVWIPKYRYHVIAGKIAAAIDNQLPYGNMIMIETPWDALPLEMLENLEIHPGESIYHLYAHLETAPVIKEGWAECGDLLGNVGKTGYNVPVPHLHLETRIGPAGIELKEMGYYSTSASEDARANYELWRMSGLFRHFDPMILFEISGNIPGEGE